MTLHKEGYSILIFSLLLLAALNWLAYSYLPPFAFMLLLLGSVILYGLFVQFFRHPKRPIPEMDEQLVYAPADGKVVVIEEAEEPEYFKGRRLQVSIFMSPLNVHVNRNPIGGTVKYVQYHPGSYLVAWHPKSSTENERTTVVIDNGHSEILIRQIAGAVARRIRNYLQVGNQVVQGTEMGFIKFGSRVDLFLPLDTRIKVDIGDKVKGNFTVIGTLNK
jgi:phosphatidylserine decarboxylase